MPREEVLGWCSEDGGGKIPHLPCLSWDAAWLRACAGAWFAPWLSRKVLRHPKTRKVPFPQLPPQSYPMHGPWPWVGGEATSGHTAHRSPGCPWAWEMSLKVAETWAGGWSGLCPQKEATLSKTRLICLKTGVAQQEQNLLCVCEWMWCVLQGCQSSTFQQPQIIIIILF